MTCNDCGDRQRSGQAAMNMLNLLRPDLHERILGSPVDPYEDSSVLSSTWVYVRQLLIDESLSRGVSEAAEGKGRPLPWVTDGVDPDEPYEIDET